jgi:hypothetical protein
VFSGVYKAVPVRLPTNRNWGQKVRGLALSINCLEIVLSSFCLFTFKFCLFLLRQFFSQLKIKTSGLIR